MDQRRKLIKLTAQRTVPPKISQIALSVGFPVNDPEKVELKESEALKPNVPRTSRAKKSILDIILMDW